MLEFAALVRTTPHPALAINHRRVVLSANDAAIRAIGIDVQDLVGRSCAEVLARLCAGRGFACAADRCVIAGGRAWSADATGTTALAADLLPPCLPMPATVLTTRFSDVDTPQQTIIILPVEPHGHASHSLEMRLLGPTELILSGNRVHLPQRRRAIELLVLLTLAGAAGVHRDRLLDTLWPDIDIGRAGQRFRVVLHAVRQILHLASLDAALQRRGDIYVLDTSGTSALDAAEFEREASAFLAAPPETASSADIDHTLTRYRGDFAEDELFGAWADPYRVHLRRVYYSLLARAARQQAMYGAFDRSAAYCEQALRSEPLQERFQVGLIACYGRLGRQADALRQYEEYRHALATELGHQPTQALRSALLHALSGDAAPDVNFFAFDEHLDSRARTLHRT